MTDKQLQTALEIIEEYKKMSNEEFAKMLEDHKDGEYAKILEDAKFVFL